MKILSFNDFCNESSQAFEESLDNYNFRISQRGIAKMKMGRNWKYDVDSMLQL